jgi:hypothetical protein
VLVVVAVALSSFAFVIPAAQKVSPSAFGDWTAPVKISNEEMFWGDVSPFAIYKYGTSNLTYSPDFGTSWTPEAAMGGRLAVDAGTLHRVNFTDPLSTLFYEQSKDNGTTWSAPYDLGLTAQNDGFYGIDMLNGSLFVYDWDSYGMSEILVRTSGDNGTTWNPAAVVTQAAMITPIPTNLVFTGNTVFMTFWNFTMIPPTTFAYELTVIRSYDMGLTWEDKQVVDIGAMPQMQEDAGKLYILYLHYELVGEEMIWMLRFTSSADSGVTWSAPITLFRFVNVADPILYYSLAVSNGRIAVAYLDLRFTALEPYTLRINYSEDDGATWNDLGDVTLMAGNEVMPWVSIVGDTLHFTFVEMGAGDWMGGVYPTYYRSMDLGGTVIPEFGILVVPAVGLLVLAMVVYSRRRAL